MFVSLMVPASLLLGICFVVHFSLIRSLTGWSVEISITRPVLGPLRRAAIFRTGQFTGVSVKSLIDIPLTGSGRVKRNTFFPLASGMFTGWVCPHLPMV
jgi:hypothetical protein